MPLISLCLAACIQEPAQPSAELPQLAVRQTVSGEVLDGAPEVHTPTLDSASYNVAPTVGAGFQIEVDQSGFYHIDLRSFDFDAYLVLRDPDGNLLAEDDDGLISVHARIVTELEAGRTYRADACALHGMRGPFELTLAAGKPEARTSEVVQALADADEQARIARLEERYGPESEEVAQALSELAVRLQGQYRHSDMKDLLERALAIREGLPHPDPEKIAVSLFNLGAIHQINGQYAESEAWFERALATREAWLGSDDYSLVDTLFPLGDSRRNLDKNEEARAVYTRALELIQQHVGLDHVRAGLATNSLAIVDMQEGRYADAIAQFDQAHKILEAKLASTHRQLALIYNNRGYTYYQWGRLTEAEADLDRALPIYENAEPPDQIGISRVLNNLGLVHTQQGLYSSAESMWERSLAIREAIHGPDHPRVAQVLNNLGLVCVQTKRFVEGEQWFERTIAAYERIYGPEHLKLATPLQNLAATYWAIGEYERALPYYERVRKIHDLTVEPDHPERITSLTNSGFAYSSLGRWAEAEAVFREALRIIRIKMGEGHPSAAQPLGGYGRLCTAEGRFEEAEAMLRQALEINRSAFGRPNPSIATSATTLGRFLRKRGKFREAAAAFREALVNDLEHLDRELPTMPEADRLRLLAGGYGPFLLMTVRAECGEVFHEDLYDLCTQWKGKATRLQSAGLRLSSGLADPEVRRLVGDLSKLQKRLLSHLVSARSDNEDEYEEQLRQLRSERVEVERSLNRRLGLDAVLASPAVHDMQARLPEDAVLVDFYVEEGIFAWVLRQSGPPEFFALGPAEPLRAAQNAFLRSRVTRGGAAAEPAADPGAELRRLLWEPLREAVGDAATVLISADGFLCELPFGILPVGEGYLMEQHRFVYMSDATRLMAQDPADTAREGAVLAVGDVNYFRADAPAEVAGLAMASSTRSRLGDTWRSLSATRDEIESIRGLHEYALEWESPFDQLDGKAASEEAVRSLIAGHRYVHVATHGYFEPDGLPSLVANARSSDEDALGEQRTAAGLLPGLLSGLVLAGVNADPEPGRDDGYLSAEEIQYLDLSACDLAVLSACETALGSARAGEGLMSLRRAFEVAGAKTVVSSLWKVDDRATATLMKHFYENYWLNGMGKAEALHQAKLRMLRQNRADFGGNARPETWGAFVLSGDWR